MKYIVLIALVFGLPTLFNWFAHMQQSEKKPPSQKGKIEEALNILELSPTASDDEIRAAHKRLIQKNHPDAGGSEYFAAKINEARDILLNNLKN